MAISDGIVSYYAFDTPGALGSEVTDSVGNYTGSIITGSPAFIPGLIGSALYFNGNDAVSLTAMPLIGSVTKVAINFWFSGTFTANYQIPFRKHDNADSPIYSFFGRSAPTANSMTIYLTTADGTGVNHPNTTLPGGWKMITLSYSGSEQKMYVNGSEVSNAAQTGSVLASNYSMVMGGQQSNAGGFANFLNGTLDEVGMWNRNLTAAEIVSLYNNGSGLAYPFTPPVVPASSQSLSVSYKEQKITSAMLNATISGTGSFAFYMTANGGTNWELVENQAQYNFLNTGSDLRWKATGTGSISKLEISY
jgi:hypothetical protein